MRQKIIKLVILLLPVLSWAEILITEQNGSLAGKGHARSHDFPVSAKVFTIKVSDADTNGMRWVEFEMTVNDLHTGNAARDSHMRMSVLDRKQYPTINFSSSVKMGEMMAGKVALPGELTINGVTKPYTFNLNLTTNGEGWDAKGGFVIVPTDFDLPLVGLGPMKVLDKVNLQLDVTF